MKSRPTRPLTGSTGDISAPAPMISDRWIWMMAAHYIERHDAMAAIEAAKIADEHLANGDLGSQRLWRNIASAIAQLTDPSSGRPN